ncbi:MAG: hypothetical protein GY834_12510, partial [Bacteroidetes bacterium]|nr:hypothetical protein [Bacteroidota bacterium]
MKKSIIALLVCVFSIPVIYAQEAENEEFKPNGKAFANVFWNYHYDFTSNASQSSAFELKRSYLGYKYSFSETLSTKITFDAGSNSSGSAFTAFLKTAQLDWKIDKGVKLSMGLIGLKQHSDQEKHWGYRYIYKSFQDQHGFSTSADLGANAEFTLHKTVKMNVFMTNGRGYKNAQDDFGQHRIGANIVMKPTSHLVFKVYVDMLKNQYEENDVIVDDPTITNLAFFAGYTSANFRFGIEYDMLKNGEKYSLAAEDHNLNGFSTYATYIIDKKFEVFARYDQLASNTLVSETDPWNLSKNGSAIITGI